MTALNQDQKDAFQAIQRSSHCDTLLEYFEDQLRTFDKHNRTAQPSAFTAGQAAFCADVIQLLTKPKTKGT